MKRFQTGINSLAKLALTAAMGAVFVLGTGGVTYCQDAGADAAPAYAHIAWGSVTDGDACVLGDNPKWLLGAYRVGAGEWETNPPAWHVGATETNAASLNLDLDRNALPSGNIKYWLNYFDAPNGTLYVDLLNSNGVATATNLFGNLQKGSNVEAVVCMDIPLPREAAVIQVRRGSGETRVYESLITLDESGADLQGQAKATYYYAGLGGWEGAQGGPVLDALNAKARDAGGSGSLAGNRKGLRSLAGTRKDTGGAVNLRIFTHLE